MARAARVAAILAFVAIAATSFQRFYFDIYRFDRDALAAQQTELPYRQLPGFRQMLLEVEKRTPRGARILLYTPHQQGERGYAYAFPRAHYILTQRELIPIREPRTEAPRPVNLREVDYIACWKDCPPVPGFAAAWRSNDGMLLARR